MDIDSKLLKGLIPKQTEENKERPKARERVLTANFKIPAVDLAEKRISDQIGKDDEERESLKSERKE